MNPKYAVNMLIHRNPRLVNLGYFGHMWELYALWTWVPMFIVHSPESATLHGYDQILVFVTMGALGVVGCLIGGWAADRFGRKRAAVAALSVSGACCVFSPVAFTASGPLLAVFCGIWGASVIADSGVFSTALSEVSDKRFIGTALSAQTAVGFALSVGSIQLVPVIAGIIGWQYAFLILVPGPMIGVVAMARLKCSELGFRSTVMQR